MHGHAWRENQSEYSTPSKLACALLLPAMSEEQLEGAYEILQAGLRLRFKRPAFCFAAATAAACRQA